MAISKLACKNANGVCEIRVSQFQIPCSSCIDRVSNQIEIFRGQDLENPSMYATKMNRDDLGDSCRSYYGRFAIFDESGHANSALPRQTLRQHPAEMAKGPDRSKICICTPSPRVWILKLCMESDLCSLCSEFLPFPIRPHVVLDSVAIMMTGKGANLDVDEVGIEAMLANLPRDDHAFVSELSCCSSGAQCPACAPIWLSVRRTTSPGNNPAMFSFGFATKHATTSQSRRDKPWYR